MSAALLNSTFIQGFELDDWHSDAPLHSNSIILPALFAATEQISNLKSGHTVSGKDLLLGTIVGYEVGPRVGLALYGGHILTMGWHSGAVFGPSAAAASVSKLLKLPANSIEDALGIACTQACGLMSAQYESDVKRMQHGFAARNGLLAALLARKGYIGIKKVYERPYGGFLAQFGKGNGQTPEYRTDEIAKDLGMIWQTTGIRVKPYAAMAGTHCTIDCIKALQERNPEQLKDLGGINSIKIELSEAAYHHGGWEAQRPLTSTGAQMSNAFVAATQLVDGQVLAAQFRHDCLDRDGIWALVNKTTCEFNQDFPKLQTRVKIHFTGGKPTLQHTMECPRGVDPPLSNDQVLEKWRLLTRDVIEPARAAEIEDLILNLEKCSDVMAINTLMAGTTKNPIT